MVKISLVVSDLSGAEAIRAFLLAQACHKLGYKPEIVGFQYGHDLYAKPPHNIQVKSVPGRYYPHFLGAAQQLLPYLDGDLLYAVKPKPGSFGIALWRQFWTHQPLLLDIDDWELSWHGGDAWRYHPTPKQLYRDLFKPGGQLRHPDHPLYIKWLERWIPKAAGLTVNTTFSQQRFGGHYLPNGKDVHLFDPKKYDSQASRTKYGLTDYRILMFPGAPRPHKGVEDVLAALDLLQDHRYRLVIVGGSPYDDYDTQLQKLWGQWLIKLPRHPVEQMPEIVSAAHVVVVPQRQTMVAEAQFPLKLTDGMAMAKPILSTAVGDIPTILADTGYLVPPSDPETIATTLNKIFTQWDIAQQCGTAARQRCIQYYSVEEMSLILARIIQPLLA